MLLQINITSEEDRELANKLNDLLQKGISLEKNPRSKKWLLTKREITDLCGWSESTISKKVSEGKLTPISDDPKSSNSKVRFYVEEVLANIPLNLRKKFGNP